MVPIKGIKSAELERISVMKTALSDFAFNAAGMVITDLLGNKQLVEVDTGNTPLSPESQGGWSTVTANVRARMYFGGSHVLFANHRGSIFAKYEIPRPDVGCCLAASPPGYLAVGLRSAASDHGSRISIYDASRAPHLELIFTLVLGDVKFEKIQFGRDGNIYIAMENALERFKIVYD